MMKTQFGSAPMSVHMIDHLILTQAVSSPPFLPSEHLTVLSSCRKRPCPSTSGNSSAPSSPAMTTNNHETKDNPIAKKRPRTQPTRSVRFALDRNETQELPHHTEMETPDDVWFTRAETADMANRRDNLLRFYFDNCGDMLDQVLVLWLSSCPNQECLPKDEQVSLTDSERAALARQVAQSPARGFEKDIGRAWMVAHRLDYAENMLQVQKTCRESGMSRSLTEHALQAVAQEQSQTTTVFARALGAADAQVAQA